MTVSIILSQGFLPRDSVKLGRFITHVEQPHQNYHDPPASPPRVLVTTRDSYKSEHHTVRHSGFGSTLTSLMSASFTKGAKTKIRIATEYVKTYTMDNSDGWFQEATGSDDTRAWIERAVDRGQDIYMIVGFHTMTNATIRQESIDAKKHGGQMHLPAGLSLGAAGVIVPFENTIDPGVSANRQGLAEEQVQFVTRGEQVCALEYRQVRSKWLSSKHVDPYRLSKVCQWSSMDKLRDDEEGEDDILEVELTEMQDLDGDWDKRVVEDEVLLFHPC